MWERMLSASQIGTQMSTQSRVRKSQRRTAARQSANVRVMFDRCFPGARTVFMAGSFNEWHPAATEMIDMGAGRWVKELVLPPGRYEYRLVVDGHWMADPLCSVTVPNACGGQNSVMNLTVD